MTGRTRPRGDAGREACVGSWLLIAAVVGCGAGDARHGSRGEQARGSAYVGGQVISTVHGHPISVGDVQALVRDSTLTPQQALWRLQAERLLMAEADQRGLGDEAAVEQVARQARVQSLLQDLTDAVAVSDEEVRAAYEKSKSRFEPPERRVVVHALAQLPKNATPQADAAARAFATQMIERLAATTDFNELAAKLKHETSPHFKVRLEKLPAMHRRSALVPSFLEAMFSVPEPGMVRQPVQTVYGWHAIRVLEIRPSASTPYAEAAEILRGELELERKKKLVTELVATLRKQHRVELAADLRKTLAKLEL